MSLADELIKLQGLRDSGTLSEEEFQAAKASLLHPAQPPADLPPSEPFHQVEDNSLGRAANRYVTYYIVMSVVGLIVFLIFLVAVILPGMNSMDGPGNGPMGDICNQPNVSCRH